MTQVMSEHAAKGVSRCCLFVADSHCHVKLATSLPVDETTEETKPMPFVCQITRAVLCGTHPDIDWDLVEKAAQSSLLRVSPALNGSTEDKNEKMKTTTEGSHVIIPGFGIHPWYVPYNSASTLTPSTRPNELTTNTNERRPDACCCGPSVAGVGVDSSLHNPKLRERTAEELLALLEDALKRYPHAIVGEIGLDKLRGPPEAVQLPLFLGQLKLAARYGRPASVHCVRNFGTMLKALRDLPAEDTPPAIVMHGFTGSADFARSAMMIRKRRPASSLSLLTRSSATKAEPLRIFFGVGAGTSLRVKGFVEKTLPFLAQERRLLLETDAHHHMLHTSQLLGSKSTAPNGDGVGDKTENVVVDGELVYDAASCVQLAHLMAQMSGSDNNDNNTNDDVLAIERRLMECEETFTQIFFPASATLPQHTSTSVV